MHSRWTQVFHILYFASVVFSSDPQCSTGIVHPNPDIPACCSASCGDSCGAINCADINAAACCGHHITEAANSCNSNDPPCVIEEPSTPVELCASGLGILAADGFSCCPLSCGSCGGSGCHGRPGGLSCCASSIARKALFCETNEPPCTIVIAGEEPVSSLDATTCSLIGGILADDGIACCPATCVSCGGAGCDIRPGGPTQCCESSIKEANNDCEINQPPCVTAAVPDAPIVPADPAVVERAVNVGLFSGEIGPQEREDYLGIGKVFNDELIFQKVNNLNYAQVLEVAAGGRRVILNLEITDDTPEPVLPRIVNGEFDAQLTAFANNCAEGGIEFWIRTLHEHNGNWYPWGLLYVYNGVMSNTLEDLTASFQRVIGIFNAAGAPVKFQLNINNNNGFDDPRPLSAFWPSTEGMSSVSVTSYNRAFSTPNHQFTESFYDGFKPAYDAILLLTDLPIWIAETGTTSFETDKPTWLRETFRSIAVDFPRVEQMTWFLTNKPDEGVLLDWDLNTDEDKAAFRDGVLELWELTA